MNINRSRAVDSFKQYGGFWYQSAQKLPIDIYKDIILFHEFIETIAQLAQHHHRAQHHLVTLIQDWYEVYQNHNYDHPEYGAFVEVMYRRRIGVEYVKSFLQSMLFNTTHISYRTEDELKVYVYGTAETTGIIVSEIIGCAPAGQPYAQSLGQGIRIIHMLLDLHTDWGSGMHYIPQSILDQYQVSSEDISTAIYQHRPNEAVRNLVKYYVELHESMGAYAIKGLGYLNSEGHQGVLQLLNEYEHIVDTIQHYNYNIFHPRFSQTISGKLGGYITYWFYSLLGKKY